MSFIQSIFYVQECLITLLFFVMFITENGQKIQYNTSVYNYLTQCARNGTTLVKLNATDEDDEANGNGLIEFYFLDKSEDPNSTFFIINNKTGKISTVASLKSLVHQHKYSVSSDYQFVILDII